MLVIEGNTFYTCEEVAQKLAVTATTVRRYIQHGELQARKVGRSYLVSDRQLRAYVGERYGIDYEDQPSEPE
jgi:excisionase family DNA binding protein